MCRARCFRLAGLSQSKRGGSNGETRGLGEGGFFLPTPLLELPPSHLRLSRSNNLPPANPTPSPPFHVAFLPGDEEMVSQLDSHHGEWIVA